MSNMTVSDIEKGIAEIRACAADCEAAHSKEDELRGAVLKAIAQGAWRDPPQKLAQAVLKTSEVEFTRNCA